MNPIQRDAFRQEIALARALIFEGKLDEAFVHLERAHVLGQERVIPHAVSHWLMLRIAVRRREPLAALGQVVRIVLGSLGSSVGSVPTGNTGGSNISMFKRMPIAPDLLRIMEAGE